MLSHLVVVLMVAAQIVRPGTQNVANDLKQVALAFHNHHDATGKPPQKAEDLVPYLDKNEKLINALKTGDYVFLYGVGLLQMTQGTSNTVLAYEKDTPTKGGFVAYGDGSVKKLTADDFKKAILAKKP